MNELIGTYQLADGREIELYVPKGTMMQTLHQGWGGGNAHTHREPFEVVTTLRFVQKPRLTDVTPTSCRSAGMPETNKAPV